MVVIMTLLLPYFSVLLDNLSFTPLLLIKGIFTHFHTDYYFVLLLGKYSCRMSVGPPNYQ
jgi:hypothetical protein